MHARYLKEPSWMSHRSTPDPVVHACILAGPLAPLAHGVDGSPYGGRFRCPSLRRCRGPLLMFWRLSPWYTHGPSALAPPKAGRTAMLTQCSKFAHKE